MPFDHPARGGALRELLRRPERGLTDGRALCDGVSNGYVSMVAVAEDCRGRGVGRELVSRLVGGDKSITWVLRAGRGGRGFREKMGFRASEIAMGRVRDEAEADRRIKNSGQRRGCGGHLLRQPLSRLPTTPGSGKRPLGPLNPPEEL